LQPLLILFYATYAAQKCRVGRYDCTLDLLNLSKLTIALQETSCGSIYAVARCLTVSCPPRMICFMLVNRGCWMGTRQLLCSHLQVLNKDYLSPLLFAIYLNDIECGRQGKRRAQWHSRFSGDPPCLPMTFPSRPMTLTTCRPC